MPEEEKDLIELPKKKEKEEIAKRIELKHVIAGVVVAIVTLWIYANSQEFQALIKQYMVFILLAIFGGIYLFYHKGKGELPIGMIQAENLCRKWIDYKQRKKEMPEGSFRIEQSKRKEVDVKPEDYYFDVHIDSTKKPNSFIVSVDSKTGDIILSEPAVVTRLSEEEEAKDVFLKKKLVTAGEEEWRYE